eukprot:gene10660-3284_t
MSFSFQPQNNDLSWGPSEAKNKIPREDYPEITFSPYSNEEYIGRIADWTQTKQTKTSSSTNKQGLNYVEEDESSFNLVFRKSQRNYNIPKKKINYENQTNQKQGQKKVLKYNKNTTARTKLSKARYLPSTQVKSEWKVLNQMTFQQLSKLKANLPTVKDVKQVGSIKQFDSKYETLTLKNAIQVDSSLQKSFHKTATTSEDSEFCKQQGYDVYITDTILSKIMASTKSVYSWDIVIENKDGVLYFDRREGSKVDDYTVDETSKELPEETRTLLSKEAGYLNQICIQNVVKHKKTLNLSNYEEQASSEDGEFTVGHKYRKFALNDFSVLVRCKIDGYSVKQDDSIQYLSIKTFNERNPGLYKDDFRSTLDVNPGFVLINQHRSNACKSTRWAIEAMLSNVDAIKFLFASRNHAQNLKKHQILGLQTYNPRSYATQTGLSTSNMWGIFEHVVKSVLTAGNGKYLLMKEPMQQSIKLFSIPMDESFEDVLSDQETKDSNQNE